MRYAQKSAPPPGAEQTEYVLSDGLVDRMGDMIDPAGWQLANFKTHPIALFNHDRDQVIGKWADVRVRDGRLTGRLELAEEGTSPLIDTIRALVRQGILRAVSVGFRALKKEKLNAEADEAWGPFRFLKSELLEASLVAVPANPHALQVAKGMPRELLAEVFCKPATEDPERRSAPHRKPAKSLVHQGTTMSTLAARIKAAQSRVNELRDRLAELSARDDLADDEQSAFEALPAEIEAAQRDLATKEAAEKALAPRMSEPETKGDGRARDGEIMPPGDRRPFAIPKKKIDPVDYAFRAVAIGVRAFGEQLPVDQVARDMYGNDEFTNIVLRAAVNPAMTTVAGWAAELVQTANAAFLDRLIADSIYGPLAGMGARYDLGRNGSIKIPTRASTPRASGSWVGEGNPKPVKRIGLTPITLAPRKLAVISTFTEEMALYSTPAIEALLRQAMSDDTSEALDGFLIDNVAESTSRPAGLLNGVTPITPSAATPPTSAMIADLKALVSAIVTQGGGRSIAILINPEQAMGLSFGQTTTGDFLFTTVEEAGRKFNVRFIVSRTVPADTVIAVDAADFATATGDTPRFAVSNEATLHEEDTTPLAIGTPGAPATIAAPTRSLFQTDSIAIRLSLYVTWKMRRTGMVQTVSGVIW